MTQVSEQFDPSLVPSARSRWLMNSWTIAGLLLMLAVVLMIWGMGLLKKQQFVERMRLQGAQVTTEALGPDWLIEWGGADYAAFFNRITAIQARGATLSRADLAFVGSLSHLRRLDVSETMVGDDDLDVLSRPESLEWINLRRTRVTDLGIENIKAAHPSLHVEH